MQALPIQVQGALEHQLSQPINMLEQVAVLEDTLKQLLILLLQHIHTQLAQAALRVQEGLMLAVQAGLG